MTEKPTGGPAFPCSNTHGYHHNPGMTLRDWFAGQALNGILAATFRTDSDHGMKVKRAWDIADDMLSRRDV